MYIPMYGKSGSLHPLFYIKKIFVSSDVSKNVYSCLLLDSKALSYIHLYILSSHYYLWAVTVLHVNVYIGFCIAIVGHDRYGLGDARFQGGVDVYMSLMFFQTVSSTKINLTMVTINGMRIFGSSCSYIFSYNGLNSSSLSPLVLCPLLTPHSLRIPLL